MLTYPPLGPRRRAWLASHLRHLCFFFFVDSVPFTRDVIEGRTSLGGSESACLGLAHALAARGHDVHIFATKLRLLDGEPRAYGDVFWHPAEDLFSILQFQHPDVFCALRMPSPFAQPVPAGLTLLWNEDMLQGVNQVSAALPQVDYLVYVSEYHRQQWTGVDPPVIGAMPSWVTKNGVDLDLLMEAIGGLGETERHPHRFCYISRPERGLRPLLALWPKIRQQIPDAELHICRYDSMYDAQGWGRVCQSFDEACRQVHALAGGIVMAGQLAKPDLYRLIASSRLMLYPGVTDFAETSCIAAIEAQACGTPLIGSYRGALPETLAPGAGVLIDGDAMSEVYQDRFVAEVLRLVDGDADYQAMQEQGRVRADQYDFATIAAEWEAWLTDRFIDRYETQSLAVLRNLMHWDHHAAGRLVAEDILAPHRFTLDGIEGIAQATDPKSGEARDALRLCERVIRQEEQTADQYGEHALDPAQEIVASDRLKAVVAHWAALPDPPATLLDVAGGNGSLAILACQHLPDLTVDVWDYSAAAIEKGHALAVALGLASRIHFHVGGWEDVRGQYEAVFCGEFLEHIERPWEVLARLESHCRPGGLVTITTPGGPWSELLEYTQPLLRGHTHAFSFRSLAEMFGDRLAAKTLSTEWLAMATSARGWPCGHFILRWRPTVGDAPFQSIDYWREILTTRPYRRLVAGLIVRNEEQWIHRCLQSLWQVVDDVVVLDTGCADATTAYARRFPNVHVHQATWTEDFSQMRNACLDLAVQAYDAEWFLWIDADEHLTGAPALYKYLETAGPFAGFVIRQHHLMLDSAQFFDVPVRVFRTDRGIRFYGVIHEQPESVMDQGIFPCIDCPDVNIVHYGYETEDRRVGKMLGRNMRLLKKELAGHATHPARELAWAIYVRDAVNWAGQVLRRAGVGEPVDPARVPSEARALLLSAVRAYRQHGFDKPTHRLHHLIWGSYQIALKWLGAGIEVDFGFHVDRAIPAGRHARPVRFLAATIEEADAIARHKMALTYEAVRPKGFHCQPWVDARPADLVPRDLLAATPEAAVAPV